MEDIVRQFQQRDADLSQLRKDKIEIERERAMTQTRVEAQAEASAVAQSEAEEASKDAARESALLKATQATLAATNGKLEQADNELRKLSEEHQAQLAASRQAKINFRDGMLVCMGELKKCMEAVLAKPGEAAARLASSVKLQANASQDAPKSEQDVPLAAPLPDVPYASS